ncbi:DUF1672 family protein [Virgibacillus sp. YIM 98842]|uniref:DUF1672 family protein n=1 Tax=Virgibacillus sp. YIM 98842 TaxID=2663533 RepID=UPI0013DA5A9B|nr:DUF1672 family protein [Virgibacillus sp. YIM 98842]
MSGADNNQTTENENQQDDYEKENYVSIQDYTGEGYTLYDANEEYGKIAEENRDTVVAAVEQYFLDNYSTEVEVHNIVSAMDGVTVFVESIGEPHFNTIAIVPIDLKNEEIKTDSVWSREGEVETAIKSGLYAMAFEEEFAKLDDYLEGVTKEYDVIGTPIDVVRNVQAHGHSTSYYFISSAGDTFKKLYEEYEKNPEISKHKLKEFFKENPIEPRYLNVRVDFYMEDPDMEPDEEIFNQIVTDIEEMEGIPTGGYGVFLHDNYIDKTRGSGKKSNTLETLATDKIIKE